jgi:hypothetical protein
MALENQSIARLKKNLMGEKTRSCEKMPNANLDFGFTVTPFKVGIQI